MQLQLQARQLISMLRPQNCVQPLTQLLPPVKSEEQPYAMDPPMVYAVYAVGLPVA